MTAKYLNFLNIGLIIVLWSSLRPIYIRVNNLGIYNLISLFIGTIINIILNYIFIPLYGPIAACYSTIFCWFLINFVFDLFYLPARPMAILQIQTFFRKRRAV